MKQPKITSASWKSTPLDYSLIGFLFSVMRFFNNKFNPSALKIPKPQETDFGIVFAESSYSRTAQ